MSLVSIITTTLNSEKFLPRSIESCLNQTHQDLELIIVDGGSNDRTLEIISGFDDNRIRLIHQDSNRGKLPGAINLGLKNAFGEYITWMQDDAWYENDAIEIMLSFLEQHPGISHVYSDYWEVDEIGSLISYQRVSEPKNFDQGDVVRVCFLFKRQIYEVIGPQDTRYFPVHDVPWRYRASQQFNFSPLQIPLMYYIVHSESLTGKIGGWDLQRRVVKAFYKEQVINRKEYHKRISRIDINQAFEEFIIHGNYANFWKYSISGIFQNPDTLRNRGLLKHLFYSLAPDSNHYQHELNKKWSVENENQQNDLIENSPRQFSTSGQL